MTLNNRCLTLVVLLLMLCFKEADATATTVIAHVQSPGQTVKMELLLNEAKELVYRVWKGEVMMVEESRLGLLTSVVYFTSDLTYEGSTTTLLDESYSLPSGKRSLYRNHCNALTARFSVAGRVVQVVARAYDEGVAFRYVLEGSGDVTVLSELSECRVSSLGQVYSQFYERDYKGLTEESDWDTESCRRRSALPLLACSGTNYVLLSEAMNNGTSASSVLTTNEENRAFVYTPVGAVTAALPYSTPWRTVQVGSLASMVESSLMENLNLATAMTDVSWVKPGRAANNYIGEDTSGYLSLDNIHSYIDWASDMGWEYFTLDKGWQNSTAFTLDQVINYANSKGVGVLLWVNQNKLPAERGALLSVLQSWKNKGVKGIKADFWESDSQKMMQRYEQMLDATASTQLLLTLSSCTKPSGLRRTWPHLLSSEAVLNNSYYATSPAVIAASHNINAAIIRSSLGSTDYAPTDFADKNGRIHFGNTWAHQLALAVVFESGVQQLSEAPTIMKHHIARGFLKQLPVAWDASVCLDAAIDEKITVARRKGDDWYVASLTRQGGMIDVPLSFLDGQKSYNAYIYRDGVCRSEIAFEYREGLRSTHRLTVPVADEGGVVVVLSTHADYDKPSFLRYEAEAADNLIPFGVTVEADADSLCSGGEYVSSLGKGRSLTFRKIRVPQSGPYILTFYYMADYSRSAYVKINGRDVQTFDYPFVATGRMGGMGLGMKSVEVMLDGTIDNTIEVGNPYDLAPALDRIVISSSEGVDLGVDVPSQQIHGVQVVVEQSSLRIEAEGEVRYEVYNSLGQSFSAGIIEGGSLLPERYLSGVYIVRMVNRGGVIAQKIVVR